MAVDLTRLQEFRTQAEQEAAAAETVEALEAVRVRYLGRRGIVTQAFADLAATPPAERPRLG